jgi:hypothetical protein
MDVGQLKHIAALLDAGGQIMLGTVKPISNAAVAYDGKKTLAMLRRRAPRDSPDLLARFDAAIAATQSTGSCVDEINKPNRTQTSDTRSSLRV